MKNYGLLGWPLGHSLSPIIHKELLKICNISGDYKLYEIEPGSLKAESQRLFELSGFNVTVPHKTGIIPLLDGLDEKAALFGSVNTVKTGKRNIGFNTDCIGFLRALENADIPLCGKVLLCGNGGVARTIAFEAALAGCDLTIACRNSATKKAIDLQTEIKEKTGKSTAVCEYSKLEKGWDLIINGTSVGMLPNTNACVLDKETVQSAKAVYDVIYNPAETLLLKYAKEAGIMHENGLSMLVWQAAAAQEIWNGVNFSPKDIETVLKITEEELKSR